MSAVIPGLKFGGSTSSAPGDFAERRRWFHGLRANSVTMKLVLRGLAPSFKNGLPRVCSLVIEGARRRTLLTARMPAVCAGNRGGQASPPSPAASWLPWRRRCGCLQRLNTSGEANSHGASVLDRTAGCTRRYGHLIQTEDTEPWRSSKARRRCANQAPNANRWCGTPSVAGLVASTAKQSDP